MVGYQAFLEQLRRKWKQGQHLTISGPTGSGKTYLASDLLEMRDYVVLITTKKRDETLERYHGYKRMTKWLPSFGDNRILFFPRAKKIEDLPKQQREVYAALADMYEAGGWTPYFDDLFYLSHTLKLKEPIRMLYTQSRSNNITLVGSVQRPAWVPLEVPSQSTYLIVFKNGDKRDVDTLAEATGIDRKLMQELNHSLKQYDFLFIENGKSVDYVRRN